MGAFMMSMILATAARSGVPCAQVFSDSAAALVGNAVLAEDGLARLAKAACSTTNPDVVWAIAYKESTFRFVLARENETGSVLEGNDATALLSSLSGSTRGNVDVGVMQINWRWHGRKFGGDPLRMMDPSQQVSYLAFELAPEMRAKCRGNWVGCYHHPYNTELQAAYRSRIGDGVRTLASMLVRSFPTVATYADGPALDRSVERILSADVVPVRGAEAGPFEAMLAVPGRLAGRAVVAAIQPEAAWNVNKIVAQIGVAVYESTMAASEGAQSSFDLPGSELPATLWKRIYLVSE